MAQARSNGRARVSLSRVTASSSVGRIGQALPQHLLLLSVACLADLQADSVERHVLAIAGTFSYLCSLLHGWSRSIVHWEIQETMTEVDVE